MAGEKIQVDEQNNFIIPDNPVIPYIEGDGTGRDIWKASSRVFDAAIEKAYGGKKKIEWKEVYAGQKAYDKFGEWLPDDTIKTIRDYFIAIKGPLTTPVGGGIRSLNVALRQKLDLFACVRPVRWFDKVPSPVKQPDLVDMVIFRENTEDIYAGIEFDVNTTENNKLLKFLQNELNVNTIRFPETSALGVKPISVEGTKRLVRSAINYAIANKRPSVTLVHKGNIMKFTEGNFKKWGYDLAEEEFGDKVFTWREYDKLVEEQGKDVANEAEEKAKAQGKIIVKDAIADAFLQQILLRPTEYSVIATMNLNGDYVSDALAAMVGGIGIAPGANINYDTGAAIFEATHGTAPKYADQDKVNPGSVILSGEMMLRYLGWKEAADLVIKGLNDTIGSKKVTYDFHRQMEGATLLKCSEFGDEIIKNMD